MSNVTETQNRPVRMERTEERRFVTPAVNIAAKDGEYLIEAEMPGVSKEGLEITVEGNQLTIIGRRKPETIEGELWYLNALILNELDLILFRTELESKGEGYEENLHAHYRDLRITFCIGRPCIWMYNHDRSGCRPGHIRTQQRLWILHGHQNAGRLWTRRKGSYLCFKTGRVSNEHCE